MIGFVTEFRYKRVHRLTCLCGINGERPLVPNRNSKRRKSPSLVREARCVLPYYGSVASSIFVDCP
jgi:hypothetical protein